MRASLSRFVPQPLTAIVASGLAMLVLSLSWMDTYSFARDINWTQTVLVTLFLAVAIVLAGIYPIHIRYHTKVALTTPPLYLAAILLPAPVAALTAGLGMLTLQLMTRSQRGNLPSDIATATGRWIVVAFISAWVAHWPTDDNLAQALLLVGAALTMFVGDVVTSAFEIAPMSGESPLRVLATLLREVTLIEAVQYLLGILGALAAFQQVWAFVLLILPAVIVYVAFKNAKEMQASTRQLLESMADAVDLRDPYTGGHSRRVTEWSLRILKELKFDPSGPEVELIKAAARVHDIGKIGVPDEILNKPDQLTPEEKVIMNSHTTRGAELLARYPDFARGVDIVRHHHERWDGEGYPGKLKGLDIPFGARVIAVADSFDAMTTDRPYRPGMSVSQAARILREGRAQQWDATIVDAFLHCLKDIREQSVVNTASTMPAGNPITHVSLTVI